MTLPVASLVKVVVWDLDGTVWPGIALEAPTPPRPEVLSTLDTLAARGILVSVASRNPASVGALVEADPALAGRFVSPQYGWGRKADALRRIADDLEVQLGAVAFVDDDPFERADVERSLPEVVVLAPEEVPDALDWPEFDPGPVTAAARSRVDSYRQRSARRAARASFAGGDDDFLRWCAIRAMVRPAGPDDSDRLAELARRTTQFNSTGAAYAAGGPAAVLELTDRFGADGVVGWRPSGPVHRGRSTWSRCPAGPAAGALPVLLTGVARLARSRGASQLTVPCRLTERNVPVRLGLRQAGFTAAGRDGDVATFALDLADEPSYPDWITVDDRLVAPADRPGAAAVRPGGGDDRGAA